MVAQNPKKRNHDTLGDFGERQFDALTGEVDVLAQWICDAASQGTAAHEVERGLFDRLLRLGYTLFQGFLTMVGPGDFGEEVTLDNGRVVHRAKEQHERRLLTIFGEFTIARWVYAQRDKAKFEFVPTDQRLQLPASEVSYLLQEWDQLLGVEHAFGKVREVIETILRLKQSLDTLEHTNQQMATAAPVFRDEQGPVDMSKEGELLIVTEDNKGIPMVRPVEACRRSSDQRRKGQQEADGVHRLRLFRGSTHTHAGTVGGDVVSRSGSAEGATAASTEQALLGGTQPRTRWGSRPRSRFGVSTIGSGDRHASPTQTMADPSERRASVVGNRSANVLA